MRHYHEVDFYYSSLHIPYQDYDDILLYLSAVVAFHTYRH